MESVLKCSSGDYDKAYQKLRIILSVNPAIKVSRKIKIKAPTKLQTHVNQTGFERH
jgi:hypothetical protein